MLGGVGGAGEGEFVPDVWELVSSMFHVLNGRVWRTAIWIARSQQLAATAGHVLWGFSAPRGWWEPPSEWTRWLWESVWSEKRRWSRQSSGEH